MVQEPRETNETEYNDTSFKEQIYEERIKPNNTEKKE